MNTKDKIRTKCKTIQELLLYKNEKYGDAALSPLNIFSKSDAVNGIKVRIDDKLKRIQNAGLVDATEDTLLDLAGYLILLMIAKEDADNNIQERIRQNKPSLSPRNTSLGEDSEWEVEYSGV